MAAVQGQPEPKPTDVASPVPGASQASAFDGAQVQAGTDAGKAASAFDSAQTGQTSSGPLVDPNSITGTVLGATAKAAPTVLGIGGAITGTLAGEGVASVPLAVRLSMGGAMLGTAYKQFIEQKVLGNPSKDMHQNASEAGGEAVSMGLNTALGEAVFSKAAQAAKYLGDTKAGQAIVLKTAEMAEPVLNKIGSSFDILRNKYTGPAQEWLMNNMSNLTPKEAGGQIKQQFQNFIDTKFQGFTKAYAGLKDVASSLPVSDGDRVAFTKSLDEFAKGLPDAKTDSVLQGFRQRIDSANTFQDLRGIVGDMQQEAQKTLTSANKYNLSSLRERAGALSKAKDDLGEYMDGLVHDLADRVSKGKASSQEMDGFFKMMQGQVNPTVAAQPGNLEAYSQSVARDYLSQVKDVNKQYATFRGMLEDIGDATKVSPAKKGPNQFMSAIDDVPNEQLVTRMYQPKNAAALEAMQSNPATKGIYAQVMRSRVAQIAEESKSGMQFNVNNHTDFTKMVSILNDTPPDVRKLLIDNKMLAQMNSIKDTAVLKGLDAQQNAFMSKIVNNLAAGNAVAVMAAKAAAKSTPAKQAVGVGVKAVGSDLATTYGLQAPAGGQ